MLSAEQRHDLLVSMLQRMPAEQEYTRLRGHEDALVVLCPELIDSVALPVAVELDDASNEFPSGFLREPNGALPLLTPQDVEQLESADALWVYCCLACCTLQAAAEHRWQPRIVFERAAAPQESPWSRLTATLPVEVAWRLAEKDWRGALKEYAARVERASRKHKASRVLVEVFGDGVGDGEPCITRVLDADGTEVDDVYAENMPDLDDGLFASVLGLDDNYPVFLSSAMAFSASLAPLLRPAFEICVHDTEFSVCCT